jgi:Zn finger protein HypA/HybF involved in hydrogenase expression
VFRQKIIVEGEFQRMTLTLVEDTLSEEEQLELLASPTVKCSWCGQIIRLDGEELALAMCPSCYERMLASTNGQ